MINSLSTDTPDVCDDVNTLQVNSTNKSDQIELNQLKYVSEINSSNNFDNSAHQFTAQHTAKDVEYIVKKIIYSEDSLPGSYNEYVFDFGTVYERYTRAHQYLVTTCQNILFSNVIKPNDDYLSLKKFEILLIKKDGLCSEILEKITN